jgi:hypothetical protein
MSDTLTIGKRLILAEHVAFVEPFDPAAYPRMQTQRSFKARVVLIDRESMLTEDTPENFARAAGFRMLAEEGVATNPAIHFGVETFQPVEGFEPRKPYRSRLLWRDLDGNTQSKLLLSPPEMVLAVAVQGEERPPAGQNGEPAAARRGPATGSQRRSRRRAPAPA